MASSDVAFNATQMKTWKLNDDVTNLLASHSTNTNFTSPSKTSISSSLVKPNKNEFFMHTSTPAFSRLSNNMNTSITSVDTSVTSSFILPNSLYSGSIDKFDEQIRYLDRQLKELESSNFDDNNNSNASKNAKNLSAEYGTNQILQSASYNNLCDIKQEEAYYEKMKEKLNKQIEETEKLKHNLTKSKERALHSQHVTFSTDATQRFAHPSVFSHQLNGEISQMMGPNDEISKLKSQLRDAYSMIEELKTNFHASFVDLQQKLQECVDEKERIQFKKEKQIQELIDDAKQIKYEFEDYKQSHMANTKNEKKYIEVQKQMLKYQSIMKQLNEIVVSEERKREKSYFTDENQSDTFEEEADLLFNAILKCFDDYHGEIKHLKNLIRNNEIKSDEKDRYLDEKNRLLKEKEVLLERDLNQRIEKLKEEYEAIIDDKQGQIDYKQQEVDSLNSYIQSLKSESSNELYLKEKTIDDIKYNCDTQINNLIEEKENLEGLNENLKKEFETAKQNELNILHKYEELTHLNSIYLREIDSLKSNGQNINSALENFKVQSKTYYESIEEMNFQNATIKRERQELIIQIENLNKKLENEKFENLTVTNELKRLKDEKLLTNIILTKFNKMEQNFTDLLKDQEKLQNLLDQKRKEIQELSRAKEDLEASKKMSDDKAHELNVEKNNFDLKLKELSLKLSTLKTEFDNCSTSLHNANKNIAMLRNEKDTHNRVLQDNAIKLKNFKANYDQLQSKLEVKEKLYHDLEVDFEVYSKKCQELELSNENLITDKEKLFKELKESRFEVSNLQGTIKSLNKKLSHVTSDKDSQITQLKQSLNLCEKEIVLLKQFEKLNKNQEDNKVIEVTQTMQNKLVQKMQKYELLKAKLSSVETSAENMRKEKCELQEEKAQLEAQMITCRSRNEALQQEINNLESIVQEARKKLARYELALEKAAIKYTNLQVSNENLEKDLNKLKSLNHTMDTCGSSSNIQVACQPQQTLLQNDKRSTQVESAPNPNEIASELKTILKEMKQLVFTCNNHGNNVNTRNLTDSVDDKFLHDDSNLLLNASPNEIYNRLESKLNHLNQIGLGLKKENYETSQILHGGLRP